MRLCRLIAPAAIAAACALFASPALAGESARAATSAAATAPAAEKSAAPAAKTAAEKPARTEPPVVPAPPPGPAPSAAGFCFKDTPGEYLDAYLDGRAAARYMYANDTSTPQKAHETYKPFLHVFDAEGKSTITKGAGGYYTHHRGIFIGWTRLAVGGTRCDMWGMGGGRQEHKKFIAQSAGPDQAAVTSLVAWNLKDDKTVIEEERTFTFHRRPAPTLLLVDVTSKLKALADDVILDGDPEHAGVHYRPANEVDRAATHYCLPREGVPQGMDAAAEWGPMSVTTLEGKRTGVTRIPQADLPWAAISYSLGGKRYFAQEISASGNPPGGIWSAYRDYGRFGVFQKGEIKAGQTLTLRHRFWVGAGDPPSRAVLQKQCDEFARAPAASAPK